MAKVYVVSGNFDEARGWAREAGIPFSELIYVNTVTRLRGVTDPLIAYVGTWRNRKDLEEIRQIVTYLKVIK